MSDNTQDGGGLFIARPLISHDGADDSGVRAEVWVQRGHATISQKEDKKSRAQVKFSFACDNLKHDVNAWVHKETDKEIYDMLNKAYDDESPIYIRIEKKRKNHVDRKTPITDFVGMDAARENLINIVAGVRWDESEDWVESSESVTLPSEDSGTGSVKATPKNSGSSSFTPPDPMDSSPWNQVEAPPYKTKNSDGSVNPGSDAVAAVANTYTFVYEYLTGGKSDVVLSEDNNTARTQILDITYKVISVANKAQVTVFDGKLQRPSMSKRSHTRARALIFHAMENTNKITQEHLESKEALENWASEVLERTVKMWKWSMDTVRRVEG